MMKIWLTLQTILFELASLYLLDTEQMSLTLWLSYISSHGIASGSFTLLCWLVLPFRLKKPVIPAILFIYVIAFSMPVIGMLGLASIFMLALYFPKQESKTLWRSTHSLDLPIHPEQLEESQYGFAALKDILLFNPSDEKRLIATNSCRFLPQKMAMPLLKLALTDKADDIRLLAYAAIEKIEFNINKKIAILKAQQKKKTNADILHRIAENYWELCYLGIAEGPIRSYYLEQAAVFLKEALTLTPAAGIEFKLGRILLEQQKYQQAQQHLINAQQKGLLPRQITPYLAEVIFAQGRYQEVAAILNTLTSESQDTQNELKEFWHRAKS